MINEPKESQQPEAGVVGQGHLKVRFGEYLFRRPKLPEIFGLTKRHLGLS